MSRRPGQAKAFVRKATVTEVSDNETTARKSVWTPPPSIHTLVVKVDRLEERLDRMETFLSKHLDMDVHRQEQQEEVEQARQDLQEIKQQLDEAVQRLQQRETDLQNTQNALDNLTNQTAMDRDRIHALEVEKKGLQQLVQDLEAKLNERVKKIGLLESQVNDMKRALNNTNRNVVALQQQMQQMQQHMNRIMAGQYPVAAASPQPGAGAISPVGSTVTAGNSPQQREKIIAQAASSRCQKITQVLPPIPLNSHLAGPRASTRSDAPKFNFPPK